MTQSTYYLTNHPNSPERRKQIYGEPKPRDWFQSTTNHNMSRRNQPGGKDHYKSIKVVHIPTGEIYNSYVHAASHCGGSYTRVSDHCNGRVLNPEFKFLEEEKE